MKRCSQCGSFSDDDNLYCVNDGAVLIEVGAAGGERVVVDWDDRADEVPTQFVAVPKSPPQDVTTDNSKFLYGLIGALFAVVVVMGFYLIYTVSRGDQSSASSPTQGTPAPSVTPDPNNIGAANFSANSVRPATNAPANTMAAARNTVANVPANAATTAANTSGSLSRRFERTYSGTVGDNGVEMNIERKGNYVGGRVRPYGSYADIYLDGSIDNNGDFVMDEKSDIGVVTGVYRGRVNQDGTITGTWSKPGGDRTRNIYLRRQ